MASGYWLLALKRLVSIRPTLSYSDFKELIDILFGNHTTKMMKDRYRYFLDKLKANHLMNSFGHLKNAENELDTSRNNGFDYHTTSPVEREMREINRRADVGVRWSVTGIENLLSVKTYLAMNKP